MKSIMTDDTEHCYLCGATQNLQMHHIFFGTSNRKQSEFFGLKVPLCIYCHTESNHAVHQNIVTDMELKIKAQEKFEETHSRDQFIKIFGRSYL
jgi:hypothetical protein